MNNQFTPIDLLTLSNFSKVRKMLDESMYGQVSDRFKEINNGISKNSASLTQLRNYDRYIYWGDQDYRKHVCLLHWSTPKGGIIGESYSFALLKHPFGILIHPLQSWRLRMKILPFELLNPQWAPESFSKGFLPIAPLSSQS